MGNRYKYITFIKEERELFVDDSFKPARDSHLLFVQAYTECLSKRVRKYDNRVNSIQRRYHGNNFIGAGKNAVHVITGKISPGLLWP